MSNKPDDKLRKYHLDVLQQRLLEATPLLAAPFVEMLPEGRLREAKDNALDIAELRIDRFAAREPSAIIASAEHYAGFIRLATIRMVTEGGGWQEDEETRLGLFRAVFPCVEMVDVELRAPIVHDVLTDARAAGCVVMLSFHDFKHMPSLGVLQDMLDEASSLGADLTKIAVHTNTQDDLQNLARLLLDNRDKRLVVIAMGKASLVSRIFFPALGSRITFGYVDQPSSPGQVPLRLMHECMQVFYGTPASS